MTSPRSTPSWQRGLLGILGIALLLASLWYLGQSGMQLWDLAHSKTGLMTKSGQVLAIKLAYLTGELVALVIGGWLLQLSLKGREKASTRPESVALAKAAASPAPAQSAKRRAGKRWVMANVFQVGPEFRKLWGFNAAKRGFVLSQEHTIAEPDPLPAKLVARDWKSLLQPRLNVAWLPIDQVFLRVVQLPVAEFDETVQMVDLQLEKFSPLPVTQICWSITVLPQQTDNLQTLVITMVSRDIVQEFLGRLEGQGFLADRLEVPMVDQLQATPITGDGAWVYPGADPGRLSALVAWWYGGVLRNLGLIHVPAVENRAELLKEQINQMAWAGELEGWLAASPQWRLVADDFASATWLPLLRDAIGQPPDLIQPLVDSELAAMTANRAAQASPKSNMVPVEYTTRYHSQFIDRLWMRGLGAVIMGYLAYVIIYMAIANIQGMRADGVDREARRLSGLYTNTLQLKAKLGILQDRADLKNAALDAWKITAEKLPPGLTIQSLELKNGKSFSLFGTASREGENSVNDFYDDMRKATLNGRQFFAKMETPVTHTSGNGMTWSFNGELSRVEEATP